MGKLARALNACEEEDLYEYDKDSDSDYEREQDEHLLKEIRKTYPKTLEKENKREKYNKNNEISKEVSILIYEDKNENK